MHSNNTSMNVRYEPALGVYDEASLRAAGKYWAALQDELSAREDWEPNQQDRFHRVSIAVERAIASHDHFIDEDGVYTKVEPASNPAVDRLARSLRDYRSFEYRMGVHHQLSLGNDCRCRKCIERRAIFALSTTAPST